MHVPFVGQQDKFWVTGKVGESLRLSTAPTLLKSWIPEALAVMAITLGKLGPMCKSLCGPTAPTILARLPKKTFAMGGGRGCEGNQMKIQDKISGIKLI